MDNKNTEKKTIGIPSAQELKEKLAAARASDAMARLKSLFDADTFVELGAYTKRRFAEYHTDGSEEFEGVICGYGAVAGQPVFGFAQDSARMKGAFDATHAKKICDLYELAIKNGAPVVGIFDCAGADIFEGAAALAGYGRLMQAVSAASGAIPQIAWISGNCIGTFAAIAAMFDIAVTENGSNLYVASPSLTGAETDEQSVLTACLADGRESAAAYVRHALSFLPQNSGEGTIVENAADDLNRLLGAMDPDGDVHEIIRVIADCGDFCEIGMGLAPEIVTVLTKIGGVRCGVLACNYTENKGRLTAMGARRAAHFVKLCDAFALPLVTLVNSEGFAVCADCEGAPFAADLAKLAAAYAKADNAKITVVLRHGIGGAFAILGSKGIGADIAYALEGAEIGAMNAASAVAFAKNNEITTELTREELEEEWRAKLASPVCAASAGEIDDIVDMTELRQRIASALLLLAVKGCLPTRRHSVLPL
ncbi:MAG: hypothetical protein IJ009_04715 [Clostridia bacterium]|nr:hypothetical protein [Clostridia bacterium]